jgi:hypothetical protein
LFLGLSSANVPQVDAVVHLLETVTFADVAQPGSIATVPIELVALNARGEMTVQWPDVSEVWQVTISVAGPSPGSLRLVRSNENGGVLFSNLRPDLAFHFTNGVDSRNLRLGGVLSLGDGVGNWAAIPEPGTWVLLGGGLLVLGAVRRRWLGRSLTSDNKHYVNFTG